MRLPRLIQKLFQKRTPNRKFLEQYVRRVEARYDAAQTSPENERHWAWADHLGPNAATDSHVRRQIRSRARYELLENHCYANGIISKKVLDVVGTGPQLQVLGSRGLADTVESAWSYHMRLIQLARKLRTFASAKYTDGEGFGEFIDNPNLKSDLTVDIRLSEADLWEDPYWWSYATRLDGPSYADGISYDRMGNPISYKRANQHPGEAIFPTSYDTIDASAVLHWYKILRPGQLRGVSELAPALPLFAQHRRYVYAVISAAETAAEHAAVLETDSAAFSDTAYNPEAPIDDEVWRIPIERRAMISLPLGWKLHQLKAEQPTTQFIEFEQSIIRQLAQCVQMPLNIATGSSENSNFASARLDYILYYMSNDVERHELEIAAMEKVYDQFLADLSMVSPKVAAQQGRIPHVWTWPARPPVDEVKAAQAKQILWDLGLLTDEEELLSSQRDPEAHYERLRRQYEQRRAIGAPLPGESGRSAPVEEEEPEPAMVDDE